MGKVFSLDAKTAVPIGLIRPTADPDGVAVGKLPEGRYGAFSATSMPPCTHWMRRPARPCGKPRPTTTANARVVGSVTFYKGVIYAPTTSADEVDANDHPMVPAIPRQRDSDRSRHRKVLWKGYTIAEAPHPTHRTAPHADVRPVRRRRVSAPTVDEKRGLIYARPAILHHRTDRSTDAVVASTSRPASACGEHFWPAMRALQMRRQSRRQLPRRRGGP